MEAATIITIIIFSFLLLAPIVFLLSNIDTKEEREAKEKARQEKEEYFKELEKEKAREKQKLWKKRDRAVKKLENKINNFLTLHLDIDKYKMFCWEQVNLYGSKMTKSLQLKYFKELVQEKAQALLKINQIDFTKEEIDILKEFDYIKELTKIYKINDDFIIKIFDKFIMKERIK